MKILAWTAVMALTAAGTSLAGLQVLWDQSACVPDADASLPDAAAGCRPGVETVHQASDFHLGAPATVMRVTTYYTATGTDAFTATAEAWLWVTPKHGPQPDARTDDPRRNGRLVAVTARRVDDHHELVAADLALELHPGDYWISLTPVVPVGSPAPEAHLGSRDRFGDPSVGYWSCRTDRPVWSAAANGLDAALLIEGLRRPPAAAGTDDWPWRIPR